MGSFINNPECKKDLYDEMVLMVITILKEDMHFSDVSIRKCLQEYKDGIQKSAEEMYDDYESEGNKLSERPSYDMREFLFSNIDLPDEDQSESEYMSRWD